MRRLLLPAALAALAGTAAAQLETARGTVYHDLNRNERRDPGEPGLSGIRVSDGYTITKTDSRGRWSLPVTDDETIFVIKPTGWMTPVSDLNLPEFYYVHKPKGSPPNLRYAGVAPTGPLPASIDFPLHRSPEPRRFHTLFFGDTQSRDVREVDYLTRDVIEPLIGNPEVKTARFGVTLGDIVFDDLSVFDPHNRAIALLGLPWYNVLGNHDINFDVPNDELSDETFTRIYGPNYYSFDHGPVHFVVLDNIHWSRTGDRGSYVGRFGERQLTWLERNLRDVPLNRLVVFMMHIPLDGTQDKDEIFRLIGTRPHALSVSAHTHFHEHRFLTDGKHLKEPHHHVVNVTACGSWWRGRPDDRGIPTTTMRDGAPNGWSLFSFDGNSYTIQFRAAGMPATEQMAIYAPETVAVGAPIEVTANVWAGSEKSRVEMRLGGGPWTAMTLTPKPDPVYQAMFERDQTLQAPWRPLPAPINSPHLWTASISSLGWKGTVPIEVRSTDMFGQVSTSVRAVRIGG
ncbi:MAG: calcineurin-like phosphoesterase family protein [Fimbriimonadaceae bacterium]|nr:calcineurin-like phosphoesterase family protein [Fimbriimonadaceae bacterium]